MKQSTIFTLAIASLFALNLNAQTPTFQDFLKQFPVATLPYTFKVEDLQGQIETRPIAKIKRLSWEYYQFLPELEHSAQYSSMPVYPEPVASFETNDYYAVVYNIARGLSRGTKTYSISVFNKQGIYIGTHFVAGVNPNTLTVATIDQQLNASVQSYKVSWALNYRDNGPQGNKVTGLDPQNEQVLMLTIPGNPDEIEWSNNPMQIQASTADIAKMK
jgi:hypothetical protein